MTATPDDSPASTGQPNAPTLPGRCWRQEYRRARVCPWRWKAARIRESTVERILKQLRIRRIAAAQVL
jgi:hypothetical protein